jgi:pimeloyl-ACP methyl ester carboxylesterase
VHLTGHSLGGAVATLLALRLGQLGHDVSVTTFGAPKLTTFDAFANESRLHDLDLVRLVNAGDVVPHFPSVMDLSGTRIYAQFGREWTLTDGGCAATNLAASLTKSATMVVDRNLPAWSLDAHGMGEYADRLARLAALPEAEGRCS